MFQYRADDASIGPVQATNGMFTGILLYKLKYSTKSHVLTSVYKLLTHSNICRILLPIKDVKYLSMKMCESRKIFDLDLFVML